MIISIVNTNHPYDNNENHYIISIIKNTNNDNDNNNKTNNHNMNSNDTKKILCTFFLFLFHSAIIPHTVFLYNVPATIIITTIITLTFITSSFTLYPLTLPISLDPLISPTIPLLSPQSLLHPSLPFPLAC